MANPLTSSVSIRLLPQGIGAPAAGVAMVLEKCSQEKDVETGMLVLSMIVQNESHMKINVACQLIQLFSSCGCLNDAVRMFSCLPQPSTSAWTAIISAHSEHGRDKQALILYKQMQSSGVKTDQHTFVAVLRACAKMEALDQGKLVHSDLCKQGFGKVLFVGNSIIDMYSKCGSFEDGRRVFDSLPSRNVISWNAMVSGYLQHGNNTEALELFAKMRQEGMEPSNVTVLCILKLYTDMVTLDPGRLVHNDIHKRGLDTDTILGGALVNMYAKCYAPQDARRVFDRLPLKNVAAWSALLSAYAESELGEEAITLFCKMQRDGIKPDAVTFLCVLKACVSVRDLSVGKLVHAGMVECDQDSIANVYVGSMLVDMYAKSGSLTDAHNVLEKLQSRNVVCWSAMIDGYAEHGEGECAIRTFVNMCKEGIEPTEVTFVSLLKACAMAAAFNEGKLAHSDVIKRGFLSDVLVGNTLVDMYAKCGNLRDALKMFDTLSTHSLISWSAIISGHANHGQFQLAKWYFERMCRIGIQPDGVTFASLLTACSHAGLVDEGRFYFECMNSYNITPAMEHYACMIDLLGRAGLLQEAENLVRKMPFPPEAAILKTLLGSCAKCADLEVGERTFDWLQRCNSAPAAGYVLMANIYAANNMQDYAQRIRKAAFS